MNIPDKAMKLIQSIGKIENDYQLAKFQEEQKKEIEDAMLKCETFSKELQAEKGEADTALYLLKNWYSVRKEEKINNLQDEINSLLKIFFNGNYDLKLVKAVKRGKETLELVDESDTGKIQKSIGTMLSDGEKQIAGFTVQATTLGALNSDFIVLDEAFSSLGIKEVANIPSLLENLANYQILIIEHKEELFEDTNFQTITLESQNGITRIKDITYPSADKEEEVSQVGV